MRLPLLASMGLTMASSWPRGIRGALLARALAPVSYIYGKAALLNRGRQERRARSLSCPVISVGNITCGGTGKTPTVEMVAKSLLGLGAKPAILSRGYGAGRRSASARHLPGSGPPAGVAEGNDELGVLAANLPEVAHFQGKDRYRSGLEAMELGANVLILDDGFQHARLRRDVDLVLLDAISPFGHGRVLPAGLLREPLSVLSRADLFGITRSNQVAPQTLSTLAAYLRNRFPGIPQMTLATEAVAWVSLGGKSEPPRSLAGRRALAFCGIGNPEAFRRQLLALGVELAGVVCFRDHHRYTALDLERLRRRASSLGVEEVVMTQKDAVKLPVSSGLDSWKYLRIDNQITSGGEAYQERLRRLLAPG